ncbi:MAG: peptidoglycan-binding protein [Patescibacteria group bacterium]|nr:peptidoglycan-binding protein [Patescibacteria group bacterium]
MKKIISILIGIGVLLSVVFMPILTIEARQADAVSAEELIQSIKEKIGELTLQITALSEELVSLKKAQGEVKGTVKKIKGMVRITRQLSRGMSNEEVTLLQELLATDPEVYPEALITGYFGPLTERAVKRFQKKMRVELAGRVGPKTMSKINELLEEGVDPSGKIPPGLLIAPGIARKIGYTPMPREGRELPPGIKRRLNREEDVDEEEKEEEDQTPPVISDVTATSTTATTTNITWITDEEADSLVWYDTVTPLVISTSTASVIFADLTYEHDLLLSNLTASSTYYYLVVSADEEDNKAKSTEESFVTLSAE